MIHFLGVCDAGVATPTIDRTIAWAQEKIGKEFVTNGKLEGKDVGETGAPQRYSLSLDAIIDNEFVE